MMLAVDNIIPQYRAMTIGDRIKNARRRLNLTQEALGKAVGAEQPTVSGWETDPTRQPSRAMIPRLAKALKVTPNHLEFGGASDREVSYEDYAVDAARAPDAAQIDIELMTECIGMSMKSIVANYGIDIPKRKFDDAADAAISSYLNYFRLRASDEKPT